ncbi:MAG: TatD family hydrolase [Synergistaceae bacterium]|jgi:TatD DNase family protein|nr:TatD family hydrolase [Synergistaceae bacterium]
MPEAGGRLKLFDSHCHLDMEEFHGDVEDALARASQAGVRRALLASCDEASSFEVLKLATEKSGPEIELLASAGVHPHDAAGVAAGLPGALTDLFMCESVFAIGETGLDFYYDNSPRHVQAEIFERHIEWARKAGKPLLVHLRNAANRSAGDAYGEAMALMRLNSADQCGGVIHCFSGDKNDARTALDLGFYVSFAGPLTYPKAELLREAAAYVPLDRTLCETDSPYLAPQSRRGKRNEPAFVREVYEKLAQTRNISLETLADSIWENGERLFARVNPKPQAKP